MKKKIPSHLVGEYRYYNIMIASARLLYDIVEECIREGLLSTPENRVCAEGTCMMVKR